MLPGVVLNNFLYLEVNKYIFEKDQFEYFIFTYRYKAFTLRKQQHAFYPNI